MGIKNRKGLNKMANKKKEEEILQEQEKGFDICPAVLMADDVIVTAGNGTKEKPYKLASMRKAFYTTGEGKIGNPYKITFGTKVFE